MVRAPKRIDMPPTLEVRCDGCKDSIDVPSDDFKGVMFTMDYYFCERCKPHEDGFTDADKRQ